ncbi:hypothetical protein WDU94_015515 [Cyamophila willieti]
MTQAIQEVLSGNMGYMKASKTYHVPQSTLEDRVRKARVKNLNSVEAARKSLGRYKPVFNTEQENEIVDHVLLMEQRLFGLTLEDLRRLAYNLAESNNMNHPREEKSRVALEIELSSSSETEEELLDTLDADEDTESVFQKTKLNLRQVILSQRKEDRAKDLTRL